MNKYIKASQKIELELEQSLSSHQLSLVNELILNDREINKLNKKELTLVLEALEISSSFKCYGEGRAEHQKKCSNIIKKLTI